MNYVETILKASIPEGHPDLGHEGIVSMKAPLHEIVASLKAMGFENVHFTNRIKRAKVVAEPAA